MQGSIGVIILLCQQIKKTNADSYNRHASRWAAYKRSGNDTFHKYLEKPAMYSKVPPLKGMNVLCIGCGSGEEAAYLKSLGAKKLLVSI